MLLWDLQLRRRMSCMRRRFNLLFRLTSFLLLISSPATTTAGARQASKLPLTGLYVFGDSTVDPGNNDYIKTSTRSNFPPYGKDFPFHIPTGRFSNGRLVTDFIVSYLKIKEFVPAYLDPTVRLEDMATGVSFASAGSGFDPTTGSNQNVLTLRKQLECFKNFKARLSLKIGEQQTEKVVNNAAFLISTGSNDLFHTYFGIRPIRRQQYTISGYVNFLVQHAQQFIEELMEAGARTIVFSGLSALGCAPSAITIRSSPERRCVESVLSIARDFNRLALERLVGLRSGIGNGSKVYYFDTYTPMLDWVHHPIKYGFVEVNKGCCGTGYTEYGNACNIAVGVCADANKYVFFDAVHPTQAAYYYLFRSSIPLISQIISNKFLNN
ncbi:GDSL esterase/lipase At5g45960-like [Andrographis paniculata]|uniref:GDSL esterase/lipase At5g45960-like n=1 Tax=Andrographis paniculata TaxID=175694 RepID=UPI0021E74AF5|nr:GDSL esterase/lipase At5g45960-like [Andrographis paniculata]